MSSRLLFLKTLCAFTAALSITKDSAFEISKDAVLENTLANLTRSLECYTFVKDTYNACFLSTLTLKEVRFLTSMQAKVSKKGWVVIPAALRRRFGLKPGTLVEFREEGGKIFILPRVEDPVEELYGKLAAEVSLTDALLEIRVKEREREEEKVCIR